MLFSLHSLFALATSAQSNPVQSFPGDFRALAAHGDWLMMGREDQLSFYHWDTLLQDFQHIGTDASIDPYLVATDGDLVAVYSSAGKIEFYRLGAGPSVMLQHQPISATIELVGALAVDGLVAVGHGELFSGDRTVHVYAEPSGSVAPPELLDVIAPPVAANCPERFGNAVAIQGEIVVVGANCEGTTGEVHVFDRVGRDDTWLWVQELNATDLEIGNLFGQALSFDGSWLAVGAPGDDVFSQPVVMDLVDSGGVYLFETSPTDPFVFREYITRNGHEAGDFFGVSVELQGSVLVAGAPGADQHDPVLMTDLNDVGAVDVHLRGNGDWPHFLRLRPGAGLFHIGAGLGYRVAVGDRGPVAVAIEEETTYAFAASWRILSDGFEWGDTTAWSGTMP